MATRGEIFQKQSLREQHENGALKTGEPVPPVRQLSQEFGLSNTVVASVLGELVEEHLFHTVPRAGTFVGPPRRQGFSTFLMVLGELVSAKVDARQRAIKTGFEERVAHLGGAVLCLDEETAFARSARGELPQISGVLDIMGGAERGAFWTSNENGHKANRVRCGNDVEDARFQHVLGYDTITFDDVRIGGDSTRQVLWRMEHGEFDGITPKLGVLKIGTNHLYGDGNAGTDEEIASGISVIVSTIRAKSPTTKVLLLGLLPRQNDCFSNRTKRINALIAPLDDGETVRFLDLSDRFQTEVGQVKPELYGPDQLHLVKAGYQVWADAMQPLFDPMMK